MSLLRAALNARMVGKVAMATATEMATNTAITKAMPEDAGGTMDAVGAGATTDTVGTVAMVDTTVTEMSQTLLREMLVALSLGMQTTAQRLQPHP